MVRKEIDICVISDVHLGTYGCHAKELNSYLKSINPKILILNGDIIDMWQFTKHYFPKSHMNVIKNIVKFLSNGTKVYYLTGNHDEVLRKFSGFTLANFQIEDKLILEVNGKKVWFFHGDVFDYAMQHSRWLVKLGSMGYNMLIVINRFINFIRNKFGKNRLSVSQNIKNGVKSTIKYISNFENIIAEQAIIKGYDSVVCGHIHNPIIKKLFSVKGIVTYMNSGDWIENLTALEYCDSVWTIYRHDESQKNSEDEADELSDDYDNNFMELYQRIVLDNKIVTAII
jgi:UDP-2,3-diacylglucosamine pyrophosphatase LpxH